MVLPSQSKSLRLWAISWYAGLENIAAPQRHRKLSAAGESVLATEYTLALMAGSRRCGLAIWFHSRFHFSPMPSGQKNDRWNRMQQQPLHGHGHQHGEVPGVTLYASA